MGVLSEGAVLPTEDRSHFEELHKNLHADFKPQGVLEEFLVEKIATCFWRLRRVLCCDFRQLYRAIDQLERLQRQRAGDYVPPPR